MLPIPATPIARTIPGGDVCDNSPDMQPAPPAHDSFT
jgi:hypothetical protein